MSIQPLRGLCALSIGAMAMSWAVAADTPNLKVKMGLWEMTTHVQLSGAPIIPDDVLQKLPPEQRARMQAALAGLNKPRVLKECMTPDRLSKGFKVGERDDGDCKTTILTNTSSELALKSECSDSGGARVSNVRIIANGSESVTGTVSSVATREGKTVNVNAGVEGKWLGADCGSVKDVELENPAP
jgi:hypothetical protein